MHLWSPMEGAAVTLCCLTHWSVGAGGRLTWVLVAGGDMFIVPSRWVKRPARCKHTRRRWLRYGHASPQHTRVYTLGAGGACRWLTRRGDQFQQHILAFCRRINMGFVLVGKLNHCCDCCDTMCKSGRARTRRSTETRNWKNNWCGIIGLSSEKLVSNPKREGIREEEEMCVM